MSGKTFTNANGIGLIGSMVNRGTLNWNPTSSTTYTVQPGYYSGGTLNSAGAYTAGYNTGVTDADNRVNGNSVNYQTGYNAGYNAGKNANVDAKIVYNSKIDARSRWVIDFTATENVKNGLLIITLACTSDNNGMQVYGEVTSPLNPIATGATLTQLLHVYHGVEYNDSNDAFTRVMIYTVHDLETTDNINLQIGLCHGYNIQIIKFN